MILTPQQVEELLGIIERNQLLTIGQNLGTEFFTDADKTLLDKYEIDWRDLYSPEVDSTFTSFHFGMLSQAIGDIKAKGITYKSLKEYIKSGNYIPLTIREEAVLSHIKAQSFSDIKSLSGRVFKDINQILLNTSLEGQRGFIREEVGKGNELKQTMRQIANEIASKTGDWSRDFDRIVTYSSTAAFEHGKAQMIEHYAGEEDPTVYKTVFEKACKHCIRLYLTGGVGSEPRLFKLSELRVNGSNIGRKVDEWKPTVDPIHPYCRCVLHHAPKNTKWNNKTKTFDLTEEFKPKRKGIRVWIGGEEHVV